MDTIRSKQQRIFAADYFAIYLAPCCHIYIKLILFINIFCFSACRNAPFFKSASPELNAAVMNFRGWAANAESLALKYSLPPSPIDFATVKSQVRDKELVEAIEKFYTTAKAPPELVEWTDEEKAMCQMKIDEARADVALYDELIADTEREIQYLKDNFTTLETSGEEILLMDPDLAKEIDDEVEARAWFKDVVD